MPKVTFTLDLRDLAAKRAYFAEMAERMEDLTPVWEWAHQVLLHEMAQQFLTQGAYFEGTNWEPLSPAYEAYKHRVYGIPPSPLGILYRTGELFSSLTNEDAPGHVFDSIPWAMTFGTTVPYAQYHQTGGGRLPRRRILRLRNRFKRLLFRATMAYVLRGQRLAPGASIGESLRTAEFSTTPDVRVLGENE